MRGLIVAAVTIALAGFGALVPRPPQEPPADARAAIERSLDFIEREGFAWMDGRVPIQGGSGCVSCHHVGFGVWSLREAQRRGIERPDTQVDLLERRAYTFLTEVGCRAFSCAPLLLAADRAAAGLDVTALSAQLANEQQDNGSWRARGQFPTQRRPIEESDAVATMWAMLAQESRGADSADTPDCRANAGRWLRAGPPGENAEWLIARVLVEHRAGDDVSAESFSRRLLERQNDDGGWSWRPGQISDAMTTGQAVYALAIAGDPDTTRVQLQQAVAYLLSTQGADGTWITASELVSTEPDRAKDYIYTYWGTTWASIGLSRALDVRRPAHLKK